jgi:hypothetical protein
MLFNDLLVNGLLKGWMDDAPQSFLSPDMNSLQWKSAKDYLRTWIVNYDVIRVCFHPLQGLLVRSFKQVPKLGYAYPGGTRGISRVAPDNSNL